MSINEKVPFPARLYCLQQGLKSQPICNNPKCNKPTRWKSGMKSFRKYCCNSCSSSDPEWQKKCEESMLLSIGVRHALQSPACRKKAEQTSLKRHGKKNYM